MSENVTSEQKEKKPARFDLSDGISSEDFIALGHGILRVIVFILKIIFFPIIWVKRMLVKLMKFLFSSHAERLLTEDEKQVVSSVPVFLGFLGLTLGAAFAIIAYVNKGSNFLSSFNNVTNFFKLIGGWIKGSFDVLGNIWGFFYQDILIGTKNAIVAGIFGSTILAFFALSLIGFVGAIVILVILELKFVRVFLTKVSDLINFIFRLPFTAYQHLQKTWGAIIAKLGYPVMGGKDMLDNYSNKFYQKALRLILLFALFFLFFAFYIFITSNLASFSNNYAYLFLITVMLLAGLVAGYPVAYFLVKLLKSLSKDKYEARSVLPKTAYTATPTAAKSSVSTPAKTVAKTPVVALKGKTARERAEERRRLHEQEKKGK